MFSLYLCRSRWFPCLLFFLAAGIPLAGVDKAPAQEVKPDPAVMLLESGQRAYNEKNYVVAATQLREFLKKFGGHKDAPQARYSLSLTLIHGPEKNYAEALVLLQTLTGQKEAREYPLVMYYSGLSKRGLGLKELAFAVGKPQELPQRQQAAQQQFTQAIADFSVALTAFEEGNKKLPDDKKAAVFEWAARARCDLAEMYLRTQKPEEVRKITPPFVKDSPWTKSQYRPVGLYYHGFASFLLKDHLEAGRSLNQPGVLNHPVFGTHARYLLARVHHAQEERAEAASHYEAVLSEHDLQKKAAAELLKKPNAFQNDPEEKARVEALANGPQPDHVARSQFYLGVLQYENGQFGEAQIRLADFIKLNATSPLLAQAQLSLGFTLVQLKQYPDAQKTLQPLTQHPLLADQALFWLAKSQVGAADPGNPGAYIPALTGAIGTFGQAANKANEYAQKDPQAVKRRGEILLEQAETMILAKQYKEAAGVCLQILQAKLLPAREEEVTHRQAAALHLAGDFTASDAICQQFMKTFPKSTLLPAILFRHAENAYFQGLAVEKTPPSPEKTAQLAKLNDEIIKRYTAVIDQYPEFPQVPLARFGAALGHHRKGELDKAQALLEAIPPGDRQGQLVLVPYLLADCLIRLAPTTADDALAAGMLHEKMKAAIEHLEGFTASQPKLPETADALLKLGLCQQQMGKLVADPQEKTKALTSARTAYEKLMADFPQHPLVPQAFLERAKCMAQAGDIGGAIGQLTQFVNGPRQNDIVAPMGALELATLYRSQNKAKEAADALAVSRQQHEGKLLPDAGKANWAALLRYHHGLALQESGKLAEARTALDLAAKQIPGSLVAMQAALSYGQCLRQEGEKQIDDARKKLATPNLQPPQIDEAKKLEADGFTKLKDAATYLETRAEEFKKNFADKKELARISYEAAWSWHGLAQLEVGTVRDKLMADQKKKLEEELLKKTPPGKNPPPAVVAPIPLKTIPIQPAEQKARANYQTLIANFAELPLTNNARLELAELLADREEWDPAIKLLTDALGLEPGAELSDRLRLRLGMCLLSKGQPQEGLKQFQAVADNAKSLLTAQGHYYTGEAFMQLKNWDEAIKYLSKFRDHGPFQNLPEVADRGLLRLGHSYAQKQQWAESKQAHELVWGRFPTSPWATEAYYGAAWALQNQKQFDQAVALYEQTITRTVAEIAAKANMQIGLCRFEQKRHPEAIAALLVVPLSYDYPDWSAAALFEAHRVFLDVKNQPQAVLLLQRIISDYPESNWAKLARTELEKYKDVKTAGN